MDSEGSVRGTTIVSIETLTTCGENKHLFVLHWRDHDIINYNLSVVGIGQLKEILIDILEGKAVIRRVMQHTLNSENVKLSDLKHSVVVNLVTIF